MDFTVKIVDEPLQAPTYDAATVELLKITRCIVVGKGTESGLPTVDIQLEDLKGNQYVAMTTGSLVESLAAIVIGKRERDEAERKN
jgi:hypothetical protein